MASYIDGYAFPLPHRHLATYQQLASEVAKLWLEHGAITYQEFVGDDLHTLGTRSFSEAVAASEEEVVVFGWIEFPSRKARDQANEKVANDPRMAALMDSSDTGFDAVRMAYGGFTPLVCCSAPTR